MIVLAKCLLAIVVSQSGQGKIPDGYEAGLARDLVGVLQSGSNRGHGSWGTKSKADIAAERLVSLGVAAVPALIQGLKHEATWTRVHCAESLAKIGDRRGLQPLLAQISQEKDEYVRGSLAREVGHFKDPAAYQPLVDLIDGMSDPTRRGAIQGLGHLGDSRAIPVLIKNLTNKTQTVPAGSTVLDSSAADALAEIGEAAVPALVAAFRGGSAEVTEMAGRALGRIGSPLARDVLVAACKADRSRPAGIMGLIDCADGSAYDVAIEGLRDSRVGVRINAVRVLQKIGNRSAAPAIAEAMLKEIPTEEWHNEIMVWTAGKALGALGDRSVLPALIRAAKEVRGSDHINALALLPDMRYVPLFLSWFGESKETEDGYNTRLSGAKSAIAAVGRDVIPVLLKAAKELPVTQMENIGETFGCIRDPKAVPDLVKLLTPGQFEPVKAGAIDALGEIGDKSAVEPIVAMLNDSNKDVWESATWALARLGDGRAIPSLLRLTTESKWPDWYGQFYVKLGEQAVPSLIELLQGQSEPHRVLAADALGKLGSKSGTAALMKVLEGPDLVAAARAAAALGLLRDPLAAPALERALQNTDLDVRSEAYFALKKIVKG